jgi:trehalose synthase
VALGIDASRPLVTQVSRFDLWKDPWGVIDAYRIARSKHPGLQLALLGLSHADDDPEGAQVLESVRSYAESDPDIHLFFSPHGLPASNDEIVNGLQTHSDVLVQKSTREGFGLTVSEGMWKGKPVIGGNVGGIRLQIEDSKSGYLVDSPDQAGNRIAQLLANPELRAKMGKAAKERIREQFLMPRLLSDYLQVALQARNGSASSQFNGH